MCRLTNLFVAAALAAVGCGSSGPAAATVSGQVTVDNAPLAAGIITFTGPNGQSATGTVENGRYEVRTVAGANRVQVSAPVVVGKRPSSAAPDAPQVEITEESLPEKYHAATELTFEAQPGNNSKDWALQGKPKRR
jgi:hypothetical protein